MVVAALRLLADTQPSLFHALTEEYLEEQSQYARPLVTSWAPALAIAPTSYITRLRAYQLCPINTGPGAAVAMRCGTLHGNG